MAYLGTKRISQGKKPVEDKKYVFIELDGLEKHVVVLTPDLNLKKYHGRIISLSTL